MTDRPQSSARWWVWAAVLMTVAKLWLTRGQYVFAIGSAGHDDRLFLRLAESILQGEWLGPYDQLTLAKGPFYSLWVAGMHWLGVPLYFSQHLLYAAACAAFVRACRPALRANLAWFAVYVLLLWNPMSYDASSLGRVLRQHVYSPMVLLIFAGLIALYLRRAAPLRRLAPWAVVLGSSFGAFWLTREEGLWLVPSMLLLGGAVLLGAWRDSRAAFLRAGQALGFAVVCALLPLLAVSSLNYRYYHWFGTVEFRAAEFNDAYGAMVRVKIGPDLPFVPVTREAREAMYVVSPTFAKLRPYFEGDLGRGWADTSSGMTKLPAAELQIGGGWLVWALRDAVTAAGYGHNAGEAIAFYGRMADEINRACDEGRLPAGPHRSGFLPVWRPEQASALGETFLTFADYVVSFKKFGAFAPPSSGDDATLSLFRDLTGEQLSPSTDATNLALPQQATLNEWKTSLLHSIGKSLRHVLLGLFILAQGVAVIRVGQLAWQRSWSFPLTLAAAAWGGAAAYLLIQAIIEVTSFSVLVISSFAPVYSLVLVFIAAALWDAIAAWIAPRQPKPIATKQPDAPTAAPEIPLPANLAAASPWLLGLLALAPFLIWRRQFAELFWFGDDFFLVDQISQMGLWKWTWLVFSENFVPLFKLLWGGSVLLFDGSYHAMLWVMWLTHALNTVWLGRLLKRTGFPWLATAVVQLVFALTAANIETLGWSVQWSAVLATSFLLLALLWHEQREALSGRWSLRVHGPLLLFAAASACSFSRGVLTGAVVALAVLLPGLLAAQSWAAWRSRLVAATLCLLPAVAVAGLITVFSSGNHQHMSGHWGEALAYAARFFLLNPGYSLLGATTFGLGTILVLGGIKLAVIGWGLLNSTGRIRLLLLVLLAYDLGNAALLGVGRYHAGQESAMSSRYYYSSLLATLPFVGLLLNHAVARLSSLTWLRQSAAFALLLALAWLCLREWPATLDAFVGWRGTEVRRLMQAPTETDPKVKVPALEFMHVERAKALIRAYDLH